MHLFQHFHHYRYFMEKRHIRAPITKQEFNEWAWRGRFDSVITNSAEQLLDIQM